MYKLVSSPLRNPHLRPSATMDTYAADRDREVMYSTAVVELDVCVGLVFVWIEDVH